MMMQTLLSAAAPAHRGDPCVALRLKWHRHSCLCAFAEPSTPRMAHPMASLAAKILIANLELEFHLTQRKLSPLRISNRKFSPILCFFTNHQSRVTIHRFLIHGNAIKTQRNPFKNSNLKNSNRRQTRASSDTIIACAGSSAQAFGALPRLVSELSSRLRGLAAKFRGVVGEKLIERGGRPAEDIGDGAICGAALAVDVV